MLRKIISRVGDSEIELSHIWLLSTVKPAIGPTIRPVKNRLREKQLDFVFLK